MALAPARATAADQLVAFDEVYVQEVNGNVPGETFHHGISPKPTEPDSWVSPVNYAKGTAYFYWEVLEKPSKRATKIVVCFDGPKAGYGCFDAKSYTDLGPYEFKIEMGGGGWYQYGKIAWNQRRDDYHLVIEGGGPGHSGRQAGHRLRPDEAARGADHRPPGRNVHPAQAQRRDDDGRGRRRCARARRGRHSRRGRGGRGPGHGHRRRRRHQQARRGRGDRRQERRWRHRRQGGQRARHRRRRRDRRRREGQERLQRERRQRPRRRGLAPGADRRRGRVRPRAPAIRRR